MSLCDGLENALFVRDTLLEIWTTESKIEIVGIVDNLSLVEALSSSTSVADKRLRREIGALREMLDSGEINRIKWIPGTLQLADILTKRGVRDTKLLQVIQEGSYNSELLN